MVGHLMLLTSAASWSYPPYADTTVAADGSDSPCVRDTRRRRNLNVDGFKSAPHVERICLLGKVQQASAD